jgi:hypothetical protein
MKNTAPFSRMDILGSAEPEEGETVEVHRMAPEEACSAEMLVLIRITVRIASLSRNDHGVRRNGLALLLETVEILKTSENRP